MSDINVDEEGVGRRLNLGPRMKIALLGENYYPTLGGIQEHMHHLAHCLIAQGHDVCVITGMPRVSRWRGPMDEPWVERVGTSVRYRVMGTYTNFTIGPGVAKRLLDLFRERQFDVLHLHGPFDFGLPMLAYSLFHGPKVATLHSAFKHSFSRTLASPYYRWVLGRTDAVIAVSELAAACIRRYADFEYEVIPNGVDVAHFSRGPKMPRFDDELKNVVFLGRLEDRTGPDLLIEAFPLVLREHPDVRLIIAGSGPHGTTAHERLVPSKLKDRVTFLGAVFEERADLYATADVFVLPARFGGSFSIMVLEALASGVPVVSTPFVPRDHRNSHWNPVKICDDYSPRAIARGICEVLSEESHQRVSFGRRTVQDYDWSNVSKQISAVYERVAGRGIG